MIHGISKEVSMRAKCFLCFNNNNNRRFGTSKPVALIGCCPFKGDSSFVVDSLFYVATIVCRGSVFGHCSVMQYLVSFLILQSY